MSLLNAFVSKDSAIVAVDTDAAREDGRFATSKLLPIPHLCAVLASRGQLAVLQFVFIRTCGTGFSSFDNLLDSMDELLDDIAQTMPRELVVALPGTRNADLLALVGFSERQGRMVGTQWIRRDGGPYEPSEFTKLVAPWHPSLPQVPMTAENIERIAWLQIGLMESEHPGGAFGGRLITAAVTRSSVAVSHRLTFTQEAAA